MHIYFSLCVCFYFNETFYRIGTESSIHSLNTELLLLSKLLLLLHNYFYTNTTPATTTNNNMSTTAVTAAVQAEPPHMPLHTLDTHTFTHSQGHTNTSHTKKFGSRMQCQQTRHIVRAKIMSGTCSSEYDRRVQHSRKESLITQTNGPFAH